MSDGKMKIKDLAVELGVSAKDLIQRLHEMEIVVKNTTSTVTIDELGRIRARYRAEAESAENAKGTQPNVIVRRRRADAAPEKAPQSGGAQAASAVATEAQGADAPAATNFAAPDSSASDSSATSASDTSATATTGTTATSAADANTSCATDSPAQPAPSGAAPESSDSSAPAGSASDSPLAEAKAGRKEAKTPRQKAPQPAPTVARVIHRPDSESSVAPAATGEEAAQAAPSAPCAQSPAASSDVPSTAPTAMSAPAADSPKDSAQIVKPAETHAKPVRLATPDASAMPEGSSAPTLPPRSADPARSGDSASFDDGEVGEDGQKRRPKKRPTETAAPQVRIISRPSPEAVQRAADSRNAENARPARPAYAGNNPRPAGGPGGPRPAGPRPGGYQGGAPGGAPRPPYGGGNAGGPGGPGGAGGPGAPGSPDARDAQSKKKRTKGRRTVEFQGQGAGDFGRRNDEEHPRLSRGKGRRKGGKDLRQQPNTTQPLKAAKRKLRVTEAIRVADMAHQMGLKSNEIIKVLFGLGIMATINQSLDIETATLVAAEFDYEVEKAGFSEDDYLIPTEADTPEQMMQRPPVVTIMGHVDHGKTSLLDAIRKSNVTSGEAGGITQHIGAYHVKTKRGEIVFLDTPGHEAFTAMRARGAQVTDLVVLVVAADDGVMEQTREAINHSKAAGVPIMVAVNKMDKPGADPDRVLRELAELGLQAESWGGDTVTAHVSAKTREGLDELLELIALQAEILELKANPAKAARGHIVEAKLDKGRGPVATVLIQEGTLHQGDTFVCGVFSGRVRSLFNDQGKKIKEAGPAMPVEVQGFEGVPEAGEEFICVTDEKLARRIAETRSVKQRERELAKESKVTLETFLSRSPTDQEALTLNLVLKADVQGSLEAITENLLKQSTEKVRINVVHGGAGAISESDILLASASQAIIIGFNVRPTAKIKEVADRENVDIRYYDIIYKLADEIKSAMAGMLAPVQREVYLGQADVRESISVPKVGIIAGCHISDGKFLRNAGVRLLRDGVVIYTGKISSLKRFKDDVREVLKGYECGIGLENYNDIKVNDVIEAFEMIEEAATL